MPARSVPRNALVLLLPATLVGLGLVARAAAARSFAAFTGYRTPFAFADVPQEPLRPLTSRVVMVLLDGLGMEPSRGMPFLNELRSRGAALECRVGLPSLSMPARAVLMTGAWQEVHGQTTNYNARALTLEHVFQLAHARGLGTALAAGAKTQTMFAPFVAHSAVYEEAPETAPFEHYQAALRREAAASAALLRRARPQLALLELNLMDEAGHGWGGRSPEYARAAEEVDAALRALAALVDLEHDTLLVTADHGHVAAGGHGGPEPEVMQVPLVLAGRAVRRGSTGSCAQVDVAPTLSVLLGLPLPSASQGRPLLEALEASPDARRQALRNAVAQRGAFLRGYTRLLHDLPLDDVGGGALAVAAVRADMTASVDPDTLRPAGAGAGEDEAALLARLRSIDAAEARAKQERLAREATVRWPRSLLLAALPLALLAALGWLRVFAPREAMAAGALGLAGAAAYHALLPAVGLAYSLTAVNKDEWVQRFFMKDMALGLLTCVAAVAALCVWRRRRGAGLLELCRLAWLCAAAFSSVFVIKVALVYARHDVFPRWSMPDQFWGMGFYLDALAVMAVGLCAPALALVAGLARLLPDRAMR